MVSLKDTHGSSGLASDLASIGVGACTELTHGREPRRGRSTRSKAICGRMALGLALLLGLTEGSTGCSGESSPTLIEPAHYQYGFVRENPLADGATLQTCPGNTWYPTRGIPDGGYTTEGVQGGSECNVCPSVTSVWDGNCKVFPLCRDTHGTTGRWVGCHVEDSYAL
jgi:hypothetical protein